MTSDIPFSGVLRTFLNTVLIRDPDEIRDVSFQEQRVEAYRDRVEQWAAQQIAAFEAAVR